MSMFHSLASILLGLASWALPIAALILRKQQTLLCCGSLTACALSLLFQLREVMYRTDIGDFAAIEDTINAVNFCAATLVIVAVGLNVLVLLKRDR
ncbi:MAG: hypothetical protein IJX69_03375 [Oscillospiraceae bacterium]|nr:hypothetical protein [Oscillospiraceae bacterium]